jgi:hypothetical protein
VGLLSAGALKLRDVHFSGQRAAAVRVSGGILEVDGAALSASMSNVAGVELSGGRALLRHVSWEGPFSTALDVSPRDGPLSSEPTLELWDSKIEDAVRGVRLRSAGRARIVKLSVVRGRAEGLLIYGTRAELGSVTVVGHEYGVSLGAGADVTAKDLVSTQAHRAGIALTHARAVMHDVRIDRAGNFGAVQLVKASLWLERFHIVDSKSYGVSAVASRVVLRDGSVVRTEDSDGGGGDGLQLRNSDSQVVSVYVDQSQGAGAWVAEGGVATLVNVTLSRSVAAGVVVETGGRLVGVSVHVDGSDGPGLLVAKGAAQVDRWTFSGVKEDALSPDCAAGAAVKVHEAPEGQRVSLRAPCVGRSPALLPELATLSDWGSENGARVPDQGSAAPQ